MAVNYDDVLDAMRAYGLDLRSINTGPNPRGKPWRCKEINGDRENRGWYLVHEITADDGERYLIGSYGIYHSNDPGTQSIALGKKASVSPEVRAAIKARLIEDRKKAKAARAAEAARAATRSARAWSKLLPVPAEPIEYLHQKNVREYGVRFTASGAVAIPLQDAAGQVHGLQFILPKEHPHRKKTGRGKTYWPAGLVVSGHFHLIGNPAAAEVCLVAEGYATGATLYEATGLPVAIAFAANNLQPVVLALRKAYRRCRFLVCADDDYLTEGNPGCTAAGAAALAVGGAWVAPVFPSDRGGKKLTDFNDLALFPDGGLHLVKQQVTNKIDELGWSQRVAAHSVSRETDSGGMKSLLTLDEGCERYSLIYGGQATVFDHVEHQLVAKSDVLDMLPDHGWRDLKLRADRKVVLMSEVGFDPAETDPAIKCNLWGGWPTQPKQGDCQNLLDLLHYLCEKEDNSQEIYEWVLKWLAYPIQHPGAKMKTALVFHGPQGVGKNLFFESVMAIYGEYGRIVDQPAIEDKHNDWASKKLFMVCDEVVARMELFHLKNKLKALVTGDRIRINPKHVAAHDERNHVNLVFLSNESQPLVLEKDDRRYTVVYVPEMLPQKFYDAVGDEIANGGIAALHHHLLHLDLGDFRPWTRPPQTRARADLIELGKESPERFADDWLAGETPYHIGPCASGDLYTAYLRWCRRNGVARPRESNHFSRALTKARGWNVGPRRIYSEYPGRTDTKSCRVMVPGEGLLQTLGIAQPAGQTQIEWLSFHVAEFRATLEESSQ